MRTKTFQLSLILFFSCIHFFSQNTKVVGYLPAYRFSSSNQIEFQKLTHLNLCFGNPDTTGNIIMADISGVKNEAILDNPNIKICISLAGGSLTSQQIANWSNLIDIPSNRPGFISKIVNYVLNNNLDGVDIDLEWDRVTSGYSPFILELDAALAPYNKILTAALPNDTLFPNITAQALNAFDFINVMSYDYTGSWAPNNPGQHSSYTYAQNGINFWKNKGLPASKIILGVPFYGYNFVNSTTAYAFTFAEMVAQNPDYAYLDNVGNAYYNGIPTIQNKTQLAKTQAGGVMIWELGQDSFGTYSLLSTIHNTLNATTSNTPPTVSISPLSSSILYVPATVILNANANDIDGTVSKVEFYSNVNTLIGTVTSPPFTFTWNAIPAGGYDITAKAIDNLGATSLSSPISITILSSEPVPSQCNQVVTWNATTQYCGGSRVNYNNAIYESKWCGMGNIPQNPDPSYQWYFLGNCSNNVAPAISLTSPTCGAFLDWSTSYTLTANATDLDGTISKVEFYDGSLKIGEDFSAPYSYIWNNASIGSHSITAKATDNLGTFTQTTPCSITINSPTSDCSLINNWSKLARYTVGDKVKYNGKAYTCIANSKGNIPSSSPTKWSYLYNCLQFINTQKNETIEALIYPNPSSQNFSIEFENAMENYNLKIYDANGRSMLDTNIKGYEKYDFGENFAKGVYYIHVGTFSENKIIKIVKK